ncbi:MULTISPECIES: MBL fold metallo-hydrolase [unclassified Prochlorococcus]|uniref:MBL fold metallo-hydrolase n=1 Tax=unclassified Prochlorococcus TaxID=2627481 RepID=UPI001F4C60CC|nr:MULTISPECIES: MBL fold metallo-hydrolase [unclassified Prochlorococcus]
MVFAFISPGIAEVLEITSFGHSSLLVKGGGHSVLLNPFKAVGCAARLIEPIANPDIILASSELPDEGYWKKKGVFFVKPGSYRINGLRLEGFSNPHDRLGGRRFGYGTFWQWNQGGLNFVHLGGIAGPLDSQDKLLLGRPDVLFIGVGGGAKVYNAKEAAQIVNQLNPRVVIPVQYVRGKPLENCDQTGIQPFLDATKGIESRKVGRTYVLSNTLPKKTIINLMP